MYLNHVRNKRKNIITVLTIIGLVFSLWSCQGTNMMMDRQLQESVNVKDCKMKSLQGIDMVDLAEIPPYQQKAYRKQIAKWYYSAWSKYNSEGPKSEVWKIKESELIPNQLPITIIARDTIKDSAKLVAVARLKKDNEEDDNKEKIFPEGTYKLSGLYVDEHYRGRGLGRAITKEILSIAARKDAQFFGFFSHPEEAQEMYKHWGFQLHDTKKIHNKAAAIYLIKNPSFKSMLAKLSGQYSEEGEGAELSVIS